MCGFESGNQEVNPYETYQQYLALKNHFTLDKFDFFRYKGKVNAPISAYNARSDLYHFERLSKISDISKVMLAHVSDNPAIWIGEISEKSDVFRQWQKRQSSLQYSFQEHLKLIDMPSAIQTEGPHPELLKKYLRHEISKETMIILNSIICYVPYWDTRIHDDLVWPKIKFDLKKYSSFLKFDSHKYKVLLDTHMKNT